MAHNPTRFVFFFKKIQFIENNYLSCLKHLYFASRFKLNNRFIFDAIIKFYVLFSTGHRQNFVAQYALRGARAH